jgi:transglutaminase-like putative cysteine protease
MILEVQHETRLEYSEPVTEILTEVRMEPCSDPEQTCHSFHLRVSPTTQVFRYQDGFSNHVHHFNQLAATEQVRILAASVVETHPRKRDPLSSRAAYPLALDGDELSVLDFLKCIGPVRRTPRLNPLLEKLRPQPGTRLGHFVAGVASYIRTHFEYARDVTLASSPVDDLLEHGKGVCQDFTHLMIALLRCYGVPARYVSGYIHRPNKDSQSHAWCEVWLPDLGWFGIDPTNDRVVDDRFVKVALGRDFTDVPPNKGVYRGRVRESISVRVETRELDRMPSLSWQEQLPPLNVPLTAIVSRPRRALLAGDEADQQQQQQQQQ